MIKNSATLSANFVAVVLWSLPRWRIVLFTGKERVLVSAYYGFWMDIMALFCKPVKLSLKRHLEARFKTDTIGRFARCWFVFAILLSPVSVGEPLNIAVASNFRAAMKELLVVFDPEKKHDIRVSYGSSGKLFAQIVHGAPFDVFLSADSIKPEKLVEMKLVQANHQITYAIGRLALWCPVLCLNSNTEEVLLKQKFDRIAMANIKLAPYGLAAAQTMAHLDLSLKPDRVIQGENIAQVYHFVASGAAPVGFVALSQVLGKTDIKPASLWKVPQHMHGQIKQDAVLLSRGESNKLAPQFLNFLRLPSTQRFLSTQGYDSVFDLDSRLEPEHKQNTDLNPAVGVEVIPEQAEENPNLNHKDGQSL